MKVSVTLALLFTAVQGIPAPQASNGTANAQQGQQQQQGNNNPNVQQQGNNGNQNAQNNPQIQDGSNDVNGAPQVDQQTAILMQTAVDAWMRDTGVVSNFLNIGGGLQDEQTFKNQALIAHSAEVDELTHKNVLDQNMPNNQNVQQANATLSNGAFQLVVDQLRDMSLQGRAAVQGIDTINNDRCVNVLPNIDTYMREAALTIGNGQATQQSVRPQACANIQPGVNGAANVGEAPQGYVNGKLQTAPQGQNAAGTSNTLPNIPQDESGDQPDTQI